LYVSRIIEFCKRIGAFKCIKQDDQLALLKPFYFELLAIRFSFLYDPNSDGYPVIEVCGTFWCYHNYIFDILQNEKGNQAMFMRLGIIDDSKKYHLTHIHRKFKSFLHVKMENDTTIRDLVCFWRITFSFIIVEIYFSISRLSHNSCS